MTLKTSDERRKAFRAVCLHLFPDGCLQTDLLDDIDALIAEVDRLKSNYETEISDADGIIVSLHRYIESLEEKIAELREPREPMETDL